MNYYTGQPARILNGHSASLWYESYFLDASQIFDYAEPFQPLERPPASSSGAKTRRSTKLPTLDPRTVFGVVRSHWKLTLTNL